MRDVRTAERGGPAGPGGRRGCPGAVAGAPRLGAGARAHARSGDPVAIAACLGESDAFDRAMTDFARRYAEQNERDYQAFTAAIASGGLSAAEGV